MTLTECIQKFTTNKVLLTLAIFFLILSNFSRPFQVSGAPNKTNQSNRINVGFSNVIQSSPVECSVDALIEAINFANADSNSDVIELPNNCIYQFDTYYNYNSEYEFNALPIINSEIKIKGNGSTFESSHDDMRAFEISVNGKLILHDINIIDFFTSNSGGVVLNHGTFVAGNSTFASNAAIKGGVIYNLGKVDLFNTTFYYNKASG